MTEETQKEDNKTQSEESSHSYEQQKELVGAGKVIIIIDDDPTTLTLEEQLLKNAGFEVIPATNGKEAWLKLTPEVKPNLIISDVIMPDMDGFSLLKELRNNDEVMSVPILIVSARKNMEESFLSLGADDFLSKPINTEKFLEKVTTLSSKSISWDSKKEDPKTEDPED